MLLSIMGARGIFSPSSTLFGLQETQRHAPLHIPHYKLSQTCLIMKRLQSLGQSSYSRPCTAPDLTVCALCKRWRGWLRRCATSRQVAGSIPNSVSGFFIVVILQVAICSWGQIRIFPGCKCGRYVGLTNLSPSCADCHEIWEPPTSWNPHALSRPVQGFLYLYLYLNQMIIVNTAISQTHISLYILILSPQLDLNSLLSFCYF